jgi:hypothetical protein
MRIAAEFRERRFSELHRLRVAAAVFRCLTLCLRLHVSSKTLGTTDVV